MPPKLPKDWPFLDHPDTAVITLRRVMFGKSAVQLVTHDADGAWQFLDGNDLSEADASVVRLAEILERDQTLFQVAALPRGWYASRATGTGPWWVAPAGTTIEKAYGLKRRDSKKKKRV